MLSLTLKLYEACKNRLSQDYPTDYHDICAWLLGCPSDRLHCRSPYQIRQRIDYRYRILEKRYLNKPPQQAYRSLIHHLFMMVNQHPLIGSIVQQEKKNKSWLINMIQQVIAHLINHNNEIKKNIHWIGKCTKNSALREALTLASLEEYCCQIVNGQPMVIYSLRSFLSKLSEANADNW